jgi:hypothetical protein
VSGLFLRVSNGNGVFCSAQDVDIDIAVLTTVETDEAEASGDLEAYVSAHAENANKFIVLLLSGLL